jgi:hypothetical protein
MAVVRWEKFQQRPPREEISWTECTTSFSGKNPAHTLWCGREGFERILSRYHLPVWKNTITTA